MLLAAGIRVPEGIALPNEWLARVVAGEAAALSELHDVLTGLRFPVAVRSSAIGEDSRHASHAGIFTTKLQVASIDGVLDAIHEVWDSAPSSVDYRARVGMADPARMAIVVQEMVAPRVAGVAFSCDPVSGTGGVTIEASWGLGEAVVSGLVTPDHFRFDVDGALVETTLGDKSLIVVPADDGSGTVERDLPEEQAAARSLTDEELVAIRATTLRCAELIGCHADVEWALVGEDVFVLQCRPVTTVS